MCVGVCVSEAGNREGHGKRVNKRIKNGNWETKNWSKHTNRRKRRADLEATGSIKNENQEKERI